jgi:cytoskeleton protein RodZ
MLRKQNGQPDKATLLRELGAKLKALREAQNIDISEIAEDTKIQKKYLLMIEEGNIDRLPSGPYKRSFVRQYCEYLSAEDMWNTFDSLTENLRGQMPEMRIQKMEEENNFIDNKRKVFRTRNYTWVYAIVVIAVVIAAWMTVDYRDKIKATPTNPIEGGTAQVVSKDKLRSETEAEKKPAPQKPKKAAKKAAVAVPVSADKKTEVSADAKIKSEDKKPLPAVPYRLKLSAPHESVWVRVSRDGKNLFQGSLKRGVVQDFEVSGDVPLRVRFGTPKSSKVEWAGKTYDPVHSGPEPRTRFYWADGSITLTDKRQ